MNFLFELLQVALGNRNKLSKSPSTKEWIEIYTEAQRQTVVGIALYGIDKLPKEQLPPQELLLQWIGTAEIIRQQNAKLNSYCITHLQQLISAGYRATILKGQGIAKLYDADLVDLRQSGDIDSYADCGLQEALNYACCLIGECPSWDYKHLHLREADDIEIELHHHVEFLHNITKNRKLQKWFKEHEGLLFEKKGEMISPALRMNTFYILIHIHTHFFTEGVGLRQLMDYYFVLKNLHDIKREEEYLLAKDAVSKFGMERFSGGVMWVLQQVFGMPTDWMPWKPMEREGTFILNQVMKGGNFGHHSNMHKEGRVGYIYSLCGNSLRLFKQYPSESLWIPVWLLYHKCWKLYKKLTIKV